MQPICYNMYKWGVQIDVGGNNRKEPLFLPQDYYSHRGLSNFEAIASSCINLRGRWQPCYNFYGLSTLAAIDTCIPYEIL